MSEKARGKIGYIGGIITCVTAVILLAVNIFTGQAIENIYYTVMYVVCIFAGMYLIKISKKMKDSDR